MLSELQAMAEALAAHLDRAVALDDPRMHLLVHTPHHGRTDPARTRSILERQADEDSVQHAMSFGIERTSQSVVRIPARTDLGLLSRVCAPVRAQGVLLGYLWIIDAEESLTDDELGSVVDKASSMGLVLHRERLLLDLERGRDRERLRDLLSDDVTVRRAAADALRRLDRAPSGTAWRAVVVHVVGDPGAEDVRQAVEDALDRVARRLASPAALHLARGDHGVLLHDAAAPLINVVRSIRIELHSALGEAEVLTGVGEPVEDLQDAIASWQQARQALRVAGAVPGFPVDVSWSELGVYRLLLELPLDALPEGAIPRGLLELADSEGGRDVLRTIEAYLDNAGDARQTAEQLHVHRTTLYYRLGRFLELTGLDLGSGEDRLAVHVGLRLARLTGRW